MQSSHAGGRNRLASERSPYLLQHAGNPVDWWPWGAEAVAEARRRNVPLFLSIGYATCHWCHVMARESFEDAAIAKLLDERFVSVKVDREERPEVDELCMTACQIFTQLVEGRPNGGWPLSIWLEPKTLRPFFVGTYFPPEPMHGRPSFTQVIEALGNAWRSRREEVAGQAERLGAMVVQQLSPDDAPPERALPESLARDAAARLMSMHDLTHGGFGGAPKFPQPSFLELLLEVGRGAEANETASAAGSGERSTSSASTAQRDTAMLDAVSRTLASMAAGGIFDQVGGGFHRYAVDRSWTVPHFEKMLYDNGQLASLYARAARVLGDHRLWRVALDTCDFVLRDMTSPEGGFFCALDAEAEGREGVGYVWTRESFDRALVDRGLGDDIDWAARALGMDAGPNFQDPHHPDAPPSSVLVDRVIWARSPASGSGTRTRDSGASDHSADDSRLAHIRAALLDARNAGPRPGLDDKVIPAWNGFMIEGLAETAVSTQQLQDDLVRSAGRMAEGEHDPIGSVVDRFTSAAEGAADFVLTKMRSDDPVSGGLLRVWREGSAAVDASLEDYGSMACGLLALARVKSQRGAAHWMAAAKSLLDAAEARFADGRGGWFDAPADGLLFVRARSLDDGALPSGTTLMVEAHRRLAAFETGIEGGIDRASAAASTNENWRAAFAAHPSAARAASAIRAAGAALTANPLGSTGLIAVIARLRRAGAVL